MIYKPRPGLVTNICDRIRRRPLASLLLTLALMVILIPGWKSFGEKYDVRIWFRTTDPLIKVLDKFERQFGNDESLIIALHSPSGIFDVDSARLIHSLTERMWGVPQVIRVESLSNYNYSSAEGDEVVVGPFFPDEIDDITHEIMPELKAKALSHKVMPGYLVSRDGLSAMLFARLIPTLNGSPNYEIIIKETRKILDEIKSDPQLLGDHQFHILGEVAVNDAFREVAANDNAIILPILFGLIIFYLLLVFRSLTATLLPLTVVFLTLMATMGYGFWIGYKINNILSILPAILISISIADSVHIVVTYFHFRGDGMTGKDAAYLSLHKNFVPTFLTSISTMIGLLGLTMTELVPIKQLGHLAGVGCFLAWLVTIFFMGPILFWLDFKVPKHFQKKDDLGKGSLLARQIVEKIDLYKNSILIFFSLLAIGAVFLSSSIKVNSNPYEYFKKGIPLLIGNDFVKDEFGGSAGPEIMIHAGKEDGIKEPLFLKKVEAFKLWIDQQPYVNKSIDIIDIVKEMNQNLNGGDEKYFLLPVNKKMVAEELFLYTMSLPQGMELNNRMTLNYDSMRMSVLWSIEDTRGWLKHIDEFKNKAKELGLNVDFTGKFYLFQRMMDYVVFTFLRSVTMALGLVALLMMIVFRSVKIGILSLVPNLIPLILGGGLMSLSGVDLNIGSALVASVCLGIAVDDTIHFLSHYYRLRKEGIEEKDIHSYVFTYTGSALMVTTLTLASGFGLYVFGDFIPNVNFGMLCAVILTMALVIDLIFLPAFLMKIEEMRKKKTGEATAL